MDGETWGLLYDGFGDVSLCEEGFEGDAEEDLAGLGGVSESSRG